jgi:hypothetical protein
VVQRVLVLAVAVALTGVAIAPVDAVQRPVETKAMPLADTGKWISFGAVRFDPLKDDLQFRPATNTEAGNGLRFVQFRETPRQGWLDALSATGLVVLQYYPEDTYLVWGDVAAAARAEALPFVRWQGDYSPDFKQSPELKGKLGIIDNVQVLLYDDGNLSNALAAIEGIGGQVLNVFDAQPDGRIKSAIVRLDAGRQVDVRNLPTVIWTEYASPRPQFDDEMASQIVAGNYTPGGQVTGTGYIPFLTNLGLSGNGVTWAITDSGVDYANPELTARIVDGHDYPSCPVTPNQPGNDNPNGGHGTHVAGIVAGAGVVAGGVDGAGYHYGIGIAPQVNLVALNPICTGSAPWPPAGGWQELSKRALLKGAVGTNNSWTSGEGAGVGYNASARTHDFIVRDGDFDTPNSNEPFVVVFSAGNSGPNASTITAPKEAKNPIIVGASRNQRIGSIEDLANFSSRGPAIDGRLLPTISAPGEQIASTRRVAGASSCATAIGSGPPLNNYAFCSGTSMASPQVAGLSALLIQWWRDANNGATPSPAMIKALLVNGAVDMGGVPGFPNNNEGWGRVHLPGSIALGRQAVYVDQDEILTDVGQVYERTFGVPSSSDPVRITLAWTDAPGAAGANPALVNNLDLEVVADGQTYLGNVFSNGQSATGGSPDNRNNVENVYLPAGVGSVTVRVRATALPGDGVPNTGDATDQDFALVCSNCEAQPTFTLSMPTAIASVCAGTSVTRQIDLGQVLGFQQPVTMSSSGMPAPGTVAFSPNPVATLPGSTTMSIDTSGVATGDYNVVATGTAGSVTRSVTLPLFVAASPPAAPTLTTPANGASNVPPNVSFQWAAAANAFDYLVEIATDAAFTNIVASGQTRQTSFTPAQPLDTATVYFWRVTARNACPSFELFADGFESGSGGGSAMASGSFSTQPAPGDCPIGSTFTDVLSEDFEGPATGWLPQAGGLGTNSWAITTDFPFAGSRALRGVTPTSASDQRIVSPSVTLPTVGNGLTLSFMSRQSMESRTGGCWDGGFIEISTNGGSSWTQITTGLLTDPYDGPLGSGNPAQGQPAWCGDPQPYLKSVIDLAPFAGQTVQFRFRLTSDGSVARAEGWNIDNVLIRRCN